MALFKYQFHSSMCCFNTQDVILKYAKTFLFCLGLLFFLLHWMYINRLWSWVDSLILLICLLRLSRINFLYIAWYKNDRYLALNFCRIITMPVPTWVFWDPLVSNIQCMIVILEELYLNLLGFVSFLFDKCNHRITAIFKVIVTLPNETLKMVK